MMANLITSPRSESVRKHRAPKGALRPPRRARSARCRSRVRKHRAPNGALRQWSLFGDHRETIHVRKHRAPIGALRLKHGYHLFPKRKGQKAPSAKRCIKTFGWETWRNGNSEVRKHRAPNGALRPFRGPFSRTYQSASESTERQKVH